MVPSDGQWRNSARAVVEVSNDATKVFMDSRPKIGKVVCVAVLNRVYRQVHRQVHRGDDDGSELKGFEKEKPLKPGTPANDFHQNADSLSGRWLRTAERAERGVTHFS